MGDALAKALVFQAPEEQAAPSHVVWDERPAGTPEGGVRRPFLWLERPGVMLTLIYFHGNAEDLMDIQSDLLEFRDTLAINVLAVEYPGYGLSRAPRRKEGAMSSCVDPCARPEGVTTVDGIDKAAMHALQYVITTKGIPCSQVLLFGRSLGSGPALRLAKIARDRYHWTVGGVVLQCPYISIKQIASDYACMAGSMLIPTYYDNLCTLKDLCGDCPESLGDEGRWVPLLILHGEQDEVIWPYHSHTLYDEAVRQGHPMVEKAISPEASHNQWDLKADVLMPLDSFMHRHMPELAGHAGPQRPSCFSVAAGWRSPGTVSCMGRGNNPSCMGANEGRSRVLRRVNFTSL